MEIEFFLTKKQKNREREGGRESVEKDRKRNGKTDSDPSVMTIEKRAFQLCDFKLGTLSSSKLFLLSVVRGKAGKRVVVIEEGSEVEE